MTEKLQLLLAMLDWIVPTGRRVPSREFVNYKKETKLRAWNPNLKSFQMIHLDLRTKILNPLIVFVRCYGARNDSIENMFHGHLLQVGPQEIEVWGQFNIIFIKWAERKSVTILFISYDFYYIFRKWKKWNTFSFRSVNSS